MKNDKEKIEDILALHYFADSEKLELGSKLAAAYQELGRIGDMKKQVTSEFKAQEDRKQSEINSLQQKITTGYEMRETRCRVEMFPPLGVKRYFRESDGQQVHESTMTRDDYQQELPLESERSPDIAPDKAPENASPEQLAKPAKPAKPRKAKKSNE